MENEQNWNRGQKMNGSDHRQRVLKHLAIVAPTYHEDKLAVEVLGLNPTATKLSYNERNSNSLET